MRLLKFLIRNEVLNSSGKDGAEDCRAGEKSCELDQARSSGLKTNQRDIVKQ